jgi:ribosomal protein L11 methyltransferase
MFELVLRAPQALVEPVSDVLMEELDALSVSVEDADAGTEAEKALFGEPGMPVAQPGWDKSTLRALFEQEQQAEHAATLLLAQDWTAGVHLQALEAVPDEDWVRITQSQFAPVEITPSFWIVPSWHEPPAAAQKLIRLDPGLAFGTGTHPTTRMCLRWIAQHAQAWPSPRRCTAAPTSTPWTSTRPPSPAPRPTRRPTACNCAPACPTRPRAPTRWCWPTSWPRR